MTSWSGARTLVLFGAFVACFSTSYAQDSGWGPWRGWSQCSRSCGIGVSTQSRNCPSGRTCSGDAKQYRTCSIQDCPEDSIDFRAIQCSTYDEKPHRGNYYRWVPFTHSVTGECQLTCMPKGHRFYVKFTDAVTDGTQCRSDSLDICVGGRCQVVGCDMQMNSAARFDNCGVCQGNNRTCKRVDGVFSLQEAAGYVEVIEIPPGATSVTIREIGTPKNYLALRDLQGKYFVNGNYKIEHSKQIKLNGHWAKYVRSRTEQFLTITGPTDAPLTIEVLAISRAPRISYEYYAPLSSVTSGSASYKWKASDWDECSAKCAGGQRYRKVNCISSKTSAVVVSALCDKTQKPAEEDVCNASPCQPEWYTSDWSHCSLTCGVGRKVRRVHCIQRTLNGDVNMLPNGRCPGATPDGFQSCIVKTCPTWTVTLWSECSKSCGSGVQIRSVSCFANDTTTTAADPNVADAGRCDEKARPLAVRSCNIVSCDVTWTVGNWSECASSCGKGMRSRPVSCRDVGGILHPEEACDATAKPSISSDCFIDGPCRPVWHTTAWSKCTGKCGHGLQHRRVFCAETDGKDVVNVLADDACVALGRPGEMRPCQTVKPCFAQYFTGPWGKCSSACGVGLRFRTVGCYADRRRDYSEKSCIKLKKPVFVELCKEGPCSSGASTTSRPKTTSAVNAPSSPKTPGPSTRRVTIEATTKRRLESTATTITFPLNPPGVTTPTTQRVTEASTIATTIELTTEQAVTQSPVKQTTATTASPSKVTTPIRGQGVVDPDSATTIPTRAKPMLIAATVIRLNGPARMSVGDSADFRCIAYGAPDPITTWSINGVAAAALSPRVLVLSGGSHLVLTSVRASDEGAVTCRASNEGGFDSKSIRTVVETPASASFQVKSRTTRQGEPLTIRCQVGGSPSPTITWIKNGARFSGDASGRVRVDGASVIIRSLVVGDSGQYSCIAENTAGRGKADLRLVVEKEVSADCIDNDEIADCFLIKSIGFCEHSFYKPHCCKTCTSS